MKTIFEHRVRWCVVGVYAIAMAWVEAAVVYYLRTMVNRIEPYQSNPLPIMGGIGTAELMREAATLIMLMSVGVLAGRMWRERLGYAAMAFGIWDIFYYIFLKVLCGWPHSLFDWDILFLLPLPWWGPVLAPVSIASLMIIWGMLATADQLPMTRWPGERRAWATFGLGAMLALLVFMGDALRVAGQGTEAVRNVRPIVFPWLRFSTALALISAPAWVAGWQIVLRRRAELGSESAAVVFVEKGHSMGDLIPIPGPVQGSVVAADKNVGAR